MSDKLYLDGIITVIDVLNFEAYKDTSYTAKIQTEYTDLILMNKHELVDQVRYEKVLDWVNELNSSTPKLKTNKGLIDFKYIFGLDKSLKLMPTAPIKANHQHLDADLFEVQTNKVFEINVIEDLLKNLPKWDFFRIKGYLKAKNGSTGSIINYVFGRYTIENCSIDKPTTQLLFLGKNFGYHSSKIIEALNLSDRDYTLVLRDLD
jgi:G3E family GTPase